MTDFIAHLGLAIQTTMRASTDLQAVVGKTGSTPHVEYGDQPIKFPEGVSGRCWIRFAGDEKHADYGASADSSFAFIAIFDIVDIRGKKAALSRVAVALKNAFADHGDASLNTHLVDAGSNRLGASGAVSVSMDVNPADILPDIDRPVVAASITIRCAHKVPLVTV